MSIEDLLYHLQHPESLDQLTLNDINQLMLKYPYLESLKLLYDKRIKGQGVHQWDTQDLDQRLELAAHQAYQSGGDLSFSPPVFDLPVALELQDVEESVADPVIEEQITDHKENLEEPKFQLYPYEASEFIRFLSALPPTQPQLNHNPVKVREINIQSTDQLIRESIDLQPNFGTESLAKLWESQGKFQEAIAIYEKLSFEFPDKKDIFAAKIEKLKAEDSI